MKKNKPTSSPKKKAKAESYGYAKKGADNAGKGWKKASRVNDPVAKDTNKTRRKMNDPGKKGKLE
jgi:hypothetical protein